MTTTNTVKLAKFYALTFSGAQTQVNNIGWASVPGQNKLRKFFLRNNWQNDIVQVSCARAGARGGAFFLEVDSLTKEALGDVLNNWTQTLQIWDQLIADGLITRQGIKTAAGKTGTLPQTQAYNSIRNKVSGILKASTPHPQFVVKGTEEPGRILFAEYVLSLVAKAKIPKSLILEVDPTRPANGANPSEGMLMLQLLGDPAKRSPAANQRAYARSYAYLDDGLGNPNSSYVSYLVVQKLIAGEKLPIYNSVLGDADDFMVTNKLRITAESFYADPAFQTRNANGSWAVADDAIDDLIMDLIGTKCISLGGVVAANYATRLPNLTKVPPGLDNDVARILQASFTQLQNHNLRLTGDKTEQLWDELDMAMPNVANTQNTKALRDSFAELRAKQGRQMQRLERVVDDARKMKNAGRVLLADLPIGIGDRFENMNMDNVFFVTKDTKVPGKLNDPIGCIDNEAIMQEFMTPPRAYLSAQGSNITEGFSSLDKYVNALLARGGIELWGFAAPMPKGYVLPSSANLKKVVDVDSWFGANFLDAFFGFMPECVVRQMSANLYTPNDASPYTASRSLPTWERAKKKMGEGFAEALLELQKIPRFKFRQVYTALVAEYDRSVNFDFMGFEVRYQFLHAMKVKNGAIKPYDFDATKDAIVQELATSGGVGGLSHIISQALAKAGAAAILTNAAVTKAGVEDVLHALSVFGQEALIPNPFGEISGGRHFGQLNDTERAAKTAAWNKLGTKYKQRIDAVICTIVAQFAADYKKEADASPLKYIYAANSDAYDNAKALARKFSRAKLFEDEGSPTERDRRQKILTKYNLTAHI